MLINTYAAFAVVFAFGGLSGLVVGMAVGFGWAVNR